jgi:hypothetical protein
MSMHGLGALTGKEIETLMNGVNAAGGCTTPIQSMVKAIKCLNTSQIEWLGSCYVGQAPGDMSDLAFAGACMSLAKCGAMAIQGCPEDERLVMANLPSCAKSAEELAMADYVRKHRDFNGPDRMLNAASWAIARYPAAYQRMLDMRMCPAPAPVAPKTPAPATAWNAPPPPPVRAAPPPPVYVAPPPPPPVYVAPPPVNTTTQVMYDAPVRSESTPVSVTADESDGEGQGVEPEQRGMSTTTMAMFGIGGLLALGLGYLVLKKK